MDGNNRGRFRANRDFSLGFAERPTAVAVAGEESATWPARDSFSDVWAALAHHTTTVHMRLPHWPGPTVHKAAPPRISLLRSKINPFVSWKNK
jgi:hypothetical protein